MIRGEDDDRVLPRRLQHFEHLADQVVDAALASKANDVESLKAAKIGDHTVEEAIAALSAKIGEKLELRRAQYFDGKGWQKFIVNGVDLAIAKPGYYPGDLAATRDDYDRWLRVMAAGVDPYFFAIIDRATARARLARATAPGRSRHCCKNCRSCAVPPAKRQKLEH